MTPTNKQPNSRPTAASGSAKPHIFLREASGEKSLLVLVQEHGTRDVPKAPIRAHGTDESLAADALADAEEENPQGLDHLLMRLGGNGF